MPATGSLSTKTFCKKSDEVGSTKEDGLERN